MFRVAFERWVDADNEQDLPALIRESLHRVSALTAGGCASGAGRAGLMYHAALI